MHKILRMFAMTMSQLMAYRADVVIWTLVEAMEPLISFAVWFAVARTGGIAMTPQETIMYFMLIFFVNSATNSWVSFFLTQEILSGQLVKYLTKPISVFWEHIADNLTTKILRLGVPAVLIMITVGIKPDLFSFQMLSPLQIVLFLGSLLLAIVLAFSFDALFAMLAFWIEDAFQVIQFQMIFRQLASGVFIPFAVMPPLLFDSLRWLPWRYMVSAPVEILLGQIEASRIPELFIVQLVWIVFSVGLLSVLWRVGLRHYAIPGQ